MVAWIRYGKARKSGWVEIYKTWLGVALAWCHPVKKAVENDRSLTSGFRFFLSILERYESVGVEAITP